MGRQGDIPMFESEWRNIGLDAVHVDPEGAVLEGKVHHPEVEHLEDFIGARPVG